MNSRRAAASGSPPASSSPFGIDHASSSFFAQNGPPGWTRNTSSTPFLRRYGNRPGLGFGTSLDLADDGQARIVKRSNPRETPMSRIHYIALACLGINLAAAPLTAQSDHPAPNKARQPVTATDHRVPVAEGDRLLEYRADPSL